MSQRQKLAVEREKLQAELEHFRKCLTLPQTPWPRGGHYKGYPPRWPQHAELMTPWPRPPPLSDWHPEFIFHGLVHMAPWRRIWLARWMNEWMHEWMEWMEWMDRWMIQDHTVKDRQSLDCGQPGTVPRATNVCQCSQPRDQREYGAGVPEDQHKHTHTHTHLLFTHSSVPAALLFSPCIPHRHSYTDNPANEGAATPGGVPSRDLNAPKASGQSGLIFITVATWAFELEMHLRIKAEELPGGTVLQQRTVQIREELRKMHIFGKN